MREILFRGKRVNNGEFVYGDLIHDVSGEANTYINLQTIPFDKKRFIQPADVLPETVGQYTGLTDKNGKKIFEGDIVRCQFHLGKKLISSNASVVFKYGSFGVEWSWGYITDFYAFDGMRRMECEVLGNVYDNPELLEVDT